MPNERKRSLWARCRRPFRWVRIAGWSVLLLLLGSFLYFNRVGLPDFLKAPLVRELKRRGVDLEFSRLRYRWFQGFVAEQVSAGDPSLALAPEFHAGEVAIDLDEASLLRLKVVVRGVSIRGGRLAIPLVSTNAPTEWFRVEGVSARLRFLPDDEWEIGEMRGQALGARFNLTASVSHAPSLFDRASGPPGAAAGSAPGVDNVLRQAFDLSRRFRFREPPELSLQVRGNGRQPDRLAGDLRFVALDLETPWGRARELQVTGGFNRSVTNGVGRSELLARLEGLQSTVMALESSELRLTWAHALTNPIPAGATIEWDLTGLHTPWLRAPSARFSGTTRRVDEDPNRLLTRLDLTSGLLDGLNFQSRSNRLSVEVVHARDGFRPVSARWAWRADHPASEWATAASFEMQGSGTTLGVPAASNLPPPTLPGPWAGLAAWKLECVTRLRDLAVNDTTFSSISLKSHWAAPGLALDELRIESGGRAITLEGSLDIASRDLTAALHSDLDWHTVSNVLPTTVRSRLADLQWTAPPDLRLKASARLPAIARWQEFDWLTLTGLAEGQGEIRVPRATLLGVSLDSAIAAFSVRQGTASLPLLKLQRPEGALELKAVPAPRGPAGDTTLVYEVTLASSLDLAALRPWLGTNAPPIADYFVFTRPPEVSARAWIPPANLPASGAEATVKMQDATFRGEPVTSFSAAVTMTNLVASATGIELRSGSESASVPALAFEIPTEFLHLTNAVSTLDPQRLFRCINPQLARSLAPYRFGVPPRARVNGFIETKQGHVSDLRIDIEGSAFQWWRFQVPQLAASVRFVNDAVTVTNVRALFYGGELHGNFHLADSSRPDSAYHLHAITTNANLRLLVHDTFQSTNYIDGALRLDLNVTQANTSDLKTWVASGTATLKDGYLWDTPLFGPLSGAMNAVLPGVGNTTAGGATATYTITNGVIHTRDLAIQSAGMQVLLRGTCDFEGRLEAVIEAQVLRDVAVVGPIFSFVLKPITKLLEYTVTGPLGNPKLEPRHIPKPLRFPLAPFETLKDLFGGGSKKEEAPPAPPP